MTGPARPDSQACVPRSRARTRAKSGGWHTVDGEAISRAGWLERAERAGGVLAKPARLLIRSVRQDAPLGRAGRLSGLGRKIGTGGESPRWCKGGTIWKKRRKKISNSMRQNGLRVRYGRVGLKNDARVKRV